MKINLLCFTLTALMFIISPINTIAQDVAGSQDHPLVTRFPDSTIKDYDQRTFDEFQFITKARKWNEKENSNNTLTAQGEVTQIAYFTPKERSTLEVYTNYRQALVNAGFKPIFECNLAECGFPHYKAGMKSTDLVKNNDQRYFFGKLQGANGSNYVSVYTFRGDFQRIVTRLVIVENKAAETGLITVNAEGLRDDIANTGRSVIYSIYFDTGKAILKPESDATLQEIANFLRQNPNLKILVVGHTDNQGTFELNQTLSQQRADAVVAALVSKHSIQANRLKGWGAGYISPVATNRTDEGRAKNRRVELVEQ